MNDDFDVSTLNDVYQRRQKLVLNCETLLCEVGDVSIVNSGFPDNSIISGFGTHIKIDGKELEGVTKIVLTIAMDQAVKIEVDRLVKGK